MRPLFQIPKQVLDILMRVLKAAGSELLNALNEALNGNK